MKVGLYNMKDYFLIFIERWYDLIDVFRQHILISSFSILLAFLMSILLCFYFSMISYKLLHKIVFTITNIFQTISSLAMLAIFIRLIGIGLKPAVTALFLYSLIPILRNTYAAFESIDEGVVESAIGMGYSPFKRLLQIEIPLAMPYIISGIRMTSVYIISWATLAALIGAGGLGDLMIV